MSLAGYAIVALATPEAVTATSNEGAVLVNKYSGEARLTLSSSGGGASTTMDVKIQHSDDGSTGWTDSGVAFQRVENTAYTQSIGVNVDRFKKYIRVAQTVAGTTPSFVRSVLLVAKEDRSAPVPFVPPEA
ncbi:MAG TPA: hypothetical protein VJM50_23830 [Pyrinomonadaceae bacterium]|nr:hypothetical protein [Pyrinomonadaceae bacterium]